MGLHDGINQKPKTLESCKAQTSAKAKVHPRSGPRTPVSSPPADLCLKKKGLHWFRVTLGSLNPKP